MRLQSVNFSTGPVNISKEVQKALGSMPVSHRSMPFLKLHQDTVEFLCGEFKTRNAFVFSGTGTTANEAMLFQIKLIGGKGLILSNGEFGSRLYRQAKRTGLQYIEYNLAWGEIFNYQRIELIIKQNHINWILFCHCETSTGVVNNLNELTEIAVRNGCLSFVDCMSTVGTRELDLSRVSMATASSGKGLASVPGLAIVFSNIDVLSSEDIPLYLDMGYYEKRNGVPFTLSSNLLNALNVSLRQKLQPDHFQLIGYNTSVYSEVLKKRNLLSFSNIHSSVFTISKVTGTGDFVEHLRHNRIIISHESDYLKIRNFCQMAFFGYYSQPDFDRLMSALC